MKFTLKLRRASQYSIIFLTFLSIFTSYTCPTCIGRIEEKSPPFFSDEYYKPNSSVTVTPPQAYDLDNTSINQQEPVTTGE